MTPDSFPILHPVLSYDFHEVSSTIVPDITGSGSAGVIRGLDRGGAFIRDDIVFGSRQSTLCLTGGENGGFLQMPDGICNSPDGITISFYCNIHTLTNYGTLCSFGRDNCFYLSAIPDPDHEEYILLTPAATKGGRSQEASLIQWIPVEKDNWFHVTMTFDITLPSCCRFYLDGRLTGTFAHRRMNALDLQGCTDCYFGYGAMSNYTPAMSVAQVCIFPGVLPESDISGLFHISDSTRVELELESLSALFEHPVSTDLNLPAAGSMNIRITWRSLTPNVITADGKVTRPSAGSSRTEGILEAAVYYDNFTATRLYTFDIPPFPADTDIVRDDVNEVVIPFPGHIVSDLKLPLTGRSGTIFTWASSNLQLADTTGKICRPDKLPAQVVLTLTGTLGSAVYQRQFPLTVLPVYGQRLPALPVIPAGPGCKVKKVLPAAARTVPLQSTVLKDRNLFQGNQIRCLTYLLLLDADRMLYNFRRAFGKDTGKHLPLGGWEEPAGLLRGHSTGHYLSALAFAYASTQQSVYKERADYLIQELRALQLTSKGDPAAFRTQCTPSQAAQSLWSRDPGTWGDGYLSAYSPDQFALLEQYTPYATIWAPYYTLHKLLAGFLDCYLQMGSETALNCAKGIGSWVSRRLAATTQKQREKMWEMYIAGEYGGMNESLARLAMITGENTYLEAARMFDNTKILNGLTKGQDTITGIHANQHIPQIIGAMEEFKASQEPFYYHAAVHFWELVTNHYMYAIGGVGRGENFKEPDILANNIESDRNCETCAAYNMLKLTSLLYCCDPDYSAYMDYYERTLINQIASSQNPVVKANAHHRVTYMLPIGPGARREYSNDYEDFTCCHGTGMENHVRYTENIYHLGTDGLSLYVNLFLSSAFHWEEKAISLKQDTSFPSEHSRLTVNGSGSMKLHIRIPYWCRDGFRIIYNGTELPAADKNSSYFVLERAFKDQDCIEILLPYRLHLCYTPDRYEDMPAASLMYGPLVMVGISSQTDWFTLHMPPVLEDAFMIENGEMPVLWYDDLKFIPMYAAHDVAYHTYFKIDLL